MSAQHQNFVSLATRLIDKGGRPVVLSAPENSGRSYDPNIGYRYYGVMAVNEAFEIKEQNDLIQSTDKKFLIDSALPITSDMRLNDYEQEVHDQITMGEIKGVGTLDDYRIAEYSIVHLNPIQVGRPTIMYEVYARV